MDLSDDALLRHLMIILAVLNVAFFGAEVSVGLTLGAVSLIADSIDFLGDAAVYLLVALSFAGSSAARTRAGVLLALILLVPTGAFLWAVLHKVASGVPVAPWALSITGLGAVSITLTCALLSPFRESAGSLARAASLSARNDVVSKIAIICTGAATAWSGSIWPDIVVGMIVAALNLDSARKVWEAARKELDD